MTVFDGPIGPETYALIRFGYGFPARDAATGRRAMLRGLTGPDRMRRAFPKAGLPEAAAMGADYLAAQRDLRKDVPGADARRKAAWRTIRAAQYHGLLTDFARIADTDTPFRERLVHFWANHFATRTKGRQSHACGPAFLDEAIRPHIAGRFADLLKAAVTHPVMLAFLDQTTSVGPNSKANAKGRRGLNENLAREVLELHTLGVGAGYTQTDVTEFAELLTGLTFNLKRDTATVFKSKWAEPGAETVLGVRYGGKGKAKLGDIHAALDDLSVHPATALHVSRKIAAHFTADTPDPALVATMETAWRDTGGDLLAVYGAMLKHKAAWSGFGAKVKLPQELLASAMRGLGLSGDDILRTKYGRGRDWLMRPLVAMGQSYLGPADPSGFPDEATAWVQPYGLAQRITWAMATVRSVPVKGLQPDRFARDLLGDAASGRLLQAVSRAETREDGLGLALASAEFNRR